MKKLMIFALFFMGFSMYSVAQNPLQYSNTYDKQSINSFETPKQDTVDYDGFRVRVGGAFAMQFQGLDHSNTDENTPLVFLGSNFNLPTANLNLDVQLADGVKLHM